LRKKKLARYIQEKREYNKQLYVKVAKEEKLKKQGKVIDIE